ncbi:MAG TPA: Spy/CpxP family protein refolding chaperone [Pyrinomonadaceae bacterium]|nr:Spy/CpxP family protein refolding chaperone [Pyrinomonadaceae bacterium]
MKLNLQLLGLLASATFFAGAAHGQTPVQQLPSQQQQQQQTPADPILQLNLTPEQRQKIREVREQTRAERAVINERLRETNQALETALDSDNPNESLIEQRVKDVAAAQAAAMRMRILTEVKIRRVLTSEQLATLRSLRQQAREDRRDRRLEENQTRIQNRRNGVAPLLQRRQLPRRQRP